MASSIVYDPSLRVFITLFAENMTDGKFNNILRKLYSKFSLKKILNRFVFIVLLSKVYTKYGKKNV